MEERNKPTLIFRSKDPEKLVVFQAASLQNEIRFYLNDTIYFTAIECEGGCTIRLEEQKTESNNKKSTLSIIRENLKECISLFFMTIGMLILGPMGALYLSEIIHSALVFLITINILYFIISILHAVVMEITEVSPSIRSKHSAEHMMVNFLEINKRLPKSIEEVKKASRFSPKCGSRKLIQETTEELMRSIFASIFASIVSVIVSHSSYSLITTVIIILSTYYIVKFVVGKAITKYGMLSFIINPIKKRLTNIVQCANTTNKVKDTDIILAYCAAKAWMQVVYPKFYNKNEDVFEETYFES